MKSGRRVGWGQYWILLLILAGAAVLLPAAIAGRDWFTVALLGLTALVLLPSLGIGIIAFLRREPAPDFSMMAIRWLSSKARRALALVVYMIAVSVWGILTGKARGVAIAMAPVLLFLAALLIMAVRSDGWSSDRTKDG